MLVADIHTLDYTNLNLVGNWRNASPVHTEGYKVVVENPDLEVFVKAFSLSARDYAIATKLGYKRLAATNIYPPVLQPEVYSDGVFLFPLGQPLKKEVRVGDMDRKDRWDLVFVAKELGLKPFPEYGAMPLVRLGEIDYAVDPFDDSINEIYEFLLRR